MPTRVLTLPVHGGTAPDGSGNTTNAKFAAEPDYLRGGAANPAGAPRVLIPALRFGPTTAASWQWHFLCPKDYAAAYRLRWQWAPVTAGAGNVVWKVATWAAEPGVTDLAAAVFDTPKGIQQVVPAGANVTKYCEKEAVGIGGDLPFTGYSADRLVGLTLARDASHANDTYDGDVLVVAVAFDYTN